MLPDRVSNPGPLTYESGALQIAPRGPANIFLCKGMVQEKMAGWVGGGGRDQYIFARRQEFQGFSVFRMTSNI